MRSVFVGLSLLLGAGCFSSAQIRASADIIKGDIERAKRSGAMRCAPRELASAEANLDFALGELDQGNSSRAHDHILDSETASKKALLLSKDCAPRQVVVKEPPQLVVKIEETDKDGDTVLDKDDQCPSLPGPVENKGCPVEAPKDRDNDGILDPSDRCIDQPEDLDAFQDEDGCPEPGPRPAVVTITDTRILISERIYFEYDSDVIRSVSFPLLDQVAEVILELPGQRRIRVEGYSDSEGNDQYNLDLSYRRARSVVEYLNQRGVPEPRLSYVGYGEVNPVAPNDSPEGRALNRRVEFTILEPADSQRPPPSATPSHGSRHTRHH